MRKETQGLSQLKTLSNNIVFVLLIIVFNMFINSEAKVEHVEYFRSTTKPEAKSKGFLVLFRVDSQHVLLICYV